MHDERLKRVRILARLLTLLVVLVLMISAYLRLAGAGLGCADWPECYGQILTSEALAHSGFARVLHRVVATLALLLGFYLAWDCLRPVALKPAARFIALLLALMILLTVIGIWSSSPHRVWASFANMLGGLGLVVLSWRLVLATRADAEPARPAGPLWLLHAGIVALVLAVALGTLIGARYATISCATTPDCAGLWWPVSGAWAAFNPFVHIATASPLGDPGGMALHLVHRYGAVAALLLLGIAGLQALLVDATRRLAGVMLTLLAVEFALGSLTVVSGFSLWLAIAHSVTAAVLLASAMQLRLRLGAG